LTDYLGKEWFDAVQVTIEESKNLGFKVYLYDEDKWPSGFAGGFVALKDELFRMKALVARQAGQTPPDAFTPIGPSSQSLQVYRWVSPLGYDWFNGACYSDLMSRDAMRYFIEQSYQSYYDRFSQYYGDDIILEFTDEPCTIFRGRLPEGAVPYTDELPAAFRKLYGYDPLNSLYKLFVNDDGAEQFRIHYFRTVNYLFENNFTKQIADWCEAHNIGLTGHYMLETDMYGQQTWGTKVMANYRHMRQPGIDHLGRQIDEIISGKQCLSGVNQSGKKRMMSELFGCSGQAVTFEDRLWMATQQIQLGVNFLNPHLSLYTMSGCRKRDFPPNLFYQQPWWQVNAQIDIPLSRLCYAMSQGTFAADVLVIHPQESAFALWQAKYENCRDIVKGDNMTWDPEPTVKSAREKIETLDKSFKELMLALLDNQVQYDLGDETLIAQESSVEKVDGKPVFKIGRMSYATVVLPSMHTLAKETLCRLEEFKALGGRIYRCGEGPFVLDGVKSKELDRFIAATPCRNIAAFNQALNDSKEIEIAGPDSDHYLWAHLRNLDDGSKLTMISNLTRSRRFDGQVSIRGDYKGVWLLDHWSGRRDPVAFESKKGKTSVKLTLDSVESKVLIFDAIGSSGEGVILSSPELTVKQELNPADISVRRLDDNALILDMAKWSQGQESLSCKAIPVIIIQEKLNEQRYTGKLTLEYTFNVKSLSAGKKARLVLEHPEYYRIFVNGTECQYQGLEPWLDMRFMPIDITDKVIQGENSIRLECEKFSYGDRAIIDDKFARYGTEIESVYIVGDFAVEGDFASAVYDTSYWNRWGLKPEILSLKAASARLVDSKPSQVNDLAKSGLPFYSGKVEYAVELPKVVLDKRQRLYVSFEKLIAACAEIFIDDKRVGYITTLPYRLDISEDYKPGKRMRIVLYSTLRNLLGPHHHKDGEVIFNSPLSFLPEKSAYQGYSDMAADWLKGNITLKDWNDDYCLLSFGDLGTISLGISESY
jgi:hypothetical protein